ncbi:DcaP family trimeric outer membrane transporter [Chryseobacterium gleum]|uniref:DcaP family trimeric outer membrane transporter n=1 Tax=Chryseobacterium gleum TaxID=250 RepID=UPI001E39D3D7|nr:DcaP family trimeric outer membrane transporter [Chryseobacterium gleum]MCD9615234.1 DcaP family trimeric outer membrane transporter [Chryseobacterium gleum]
MMKKRLSRHFMPAFTTMTLILFQTKAHAQITLADTEPDSSGRKWSAYLKGFIHADAMLDFQKFGAKDGIVAPSIIIPQQNSMSSYFSVRQSQIGLGLKQTDKNGDSPVNAYIEIDFYGPNGTTTPRLRHGYLQWKKWLIGQTWSNFTDIRIFPNIFDFNGANGAMLLRSIQLRYTEKLSDKEALSFSLEDPGKISMTVPKNHPEWKKKSLIPVVTGMYRYGNARDYAKIGATLSPVNYENQENEYTKIGFGGMISFRKHITNLDDFRFQASYGKGMARNNIVLSGEGYDAVFDPQKNTAEMLSLFNILGIYGHWWSSKWSSTVYYSYSQVGSSSAIETSLMKRFQNAAINLIYHPYRNLRMGMEGNYASAENFEGMRSDAFRLQFSTSFSFK